MLVQKRVTREKHTPCTGRLRRLPCAARRHQRLRNSGPKKRGPQTVLAETLVPAPLLGGASGAPEKPPLNNHRSQYLRCSCPLAAVLNSKLAVLIYRGWVPFPVGDAEKRSGLRGSRRALSEGAQRPSCAAAEDRKHRRAVAVLSCKLSPATVTFGSHSFGYFSWRDKKSNSPQGETSFP